MKFQEKPKFEDIIQTNRTVNEYLELIEVLDKELEICADHAPSLDYDEDVAMEEQEAILAEIQASVVCSLSNADIKTAEEAMKLQSFWQKNINVVHQDDLPFFIKIAANLMRFHERKL